MVTHLRILRKLGLNVRPTLLGDPWDPRLRQFRGKLPTKVPQKMELTHSFALRWNLPTFWVGWVELTHKNRGTRKHAWGPKFPWSSLVLHKHVLSRLSQGKWLFLPPLEIQHGVNIRCIRCLSV